MAKKKTKIKKVKVSKKTEKGMEEAIKEAEVIAGIKVTKAKELATEGLTSKEIARDLGTNKYEASKLVKR